MTSLDGLGKDYQLSVSIIAMEVKSVTRMRKIQVAQPMSVTRGSLTRALKVETTMSQHPSCQMGITQLRDRQETTAQQLSARDIVGQ